MTEAPFTNRELTAYFNRFDEKLDAIHEQTKRTNGRVTKSEEKIVTLEKEQSNLALKVGAGVFVASTIFVFMLNKILEMI